MELEFHHPVPCKEPVAGGFGLVRTVRAIMQISPRPIPGQRLASQRRRSLKDVPPHYALRTDHPAPTGYRVSNLGSYMTTASAYMRLIILPEVLNSARRATIPYVVAASQGLGLGRHR